jgi:alkylhydroperoxidase family enzyme
MRVTQASISIGIASPTETEILNQVKTSRPNGLLPLDHALLHSLPLTKGWHELFGAIRTKTTLPSEILYLAICRVALHCRAEIPWKYYLECLEQLESSSEEMLAVVQNADPQCKGSLSEKEWAVVKYADTMTTKVEVDDNVFQLVQRAGWTDRQIVELTSVVAAYNCVSRVLVALGIQDPAVDKD